MMPFGLCNAPATFRRCMLSIFNDMVERFYRTQHRGGLKNLKLEKNGFLASYFLMVNDLCLRSRHLVLWLLGTLTGQQRFYGPRLVT